MIYKFKVYRTVTLDVIDEAYVEAESYDEAYKDVKEDKYNVQYRDYDYFSSSDNDIDEIKPCDDIFSK